MKAETGRRFINAAARSSLKDTIATTAAAEEQARTEGYEALDRLIDSITMDLKSKLCFKCLRRCTIS